MADVETWEETVNSKWTNQRTNNKSLYHLSVSTYDRVFFLFTAVLALNVMTCSIWNWDSGVGPRGWDCSPKWQLLRFVTKGFPQMGQRKEKTHTHISTRGDLWQRQGGLCTRKHTERLYLSWDLLWFGKLGELEHEHLRTSNLNTDTLVWSREHMLIQNTVTIHTENTVNTITHTQNRPNMKSLHSAFKYKHHTPLAWHAYINTDLNVYPASLLPEYTHTHTLLHRLSCNPISISAYAAWTRGIVSTLSSFYL